MIYVSTHSQLVDIIAEGEDSTLMLGGDLVFTTNEKDAIDDLDNQEDNSYIVQPRRKAGKGRSKAGLYVAIDRESAELIKQYSSPIVLAADQYLAYGLSLKEDTVVLGGGVDANNNLYLEGYVFTDKGLIETFERSNNFGGMVIDMMLKDLLSRYPDHNVHWCDPLPDAPMCDVSADSRFQTIDSVVVSGTVKRKIFTRKQGVEEKWNPLPGIAFSSLGATLFLAIAMYSWSGLVKERDYYSAEIQGYEESYANSVQSLELLRHRDFLLRQPNNNHDVISTLDTLLGRVSSIDRVIIHAVEVYSDSDERREEMQLVTGTASIGDFIVEFSVPQTDVSARVQGERLVRNLSERSGLNFEILSHRDNTIRSNELEREYWRYQLTGSIPDAS